MLGLHREGEPVQFSVLVGFPGNFMEYGKWEKALASPEKCSEIREDLRRWRLDAGKNGIGVQERRDRERLCQAMEELKGGTEGTGKEER